ncbi:MAG: tetratricopeptide repeat protein, partial [Croceivirga sp.]
MTNYIRLTCLLLFIFFQFQSLGQNQELDSLFASYKSLGKQMTNDDRLFEAILEMLWRNQEYQSRVQVDSILNQITNDINNSDNSRVSFLFNLIDGRNSLHKHDYQEAINSVIKGIDLKEFAKFKELIYLNLTGAITNYYISDYVKALEFNLTALEISEKESDKSYLSDIYNNISVIHLMTNNLEKCEEYGLKAYKIADSLDNKIAKSRATQNLAIVFTEKKEYEKAEKWYKEDLKMSETIGDSLSISRILNNLGVLYEKKENYKMAEKFYQDALKFSQLIDDKSSIVLGYQNVAWAKFKNGDNDKAKELFYLAISETKKAGNRNRLRDVYSNMSNFFEKTKNFKMAFDFQNKFILLNDSLVGSDHLKAISELELKYETQKKENELLKLSKEKQENELLITRQGRRVRQLSFGLGGLALLGILGFFLFKQRLQNKKQQELLLAISETQTEQR